MNAAVLTAMCSVPAGKFRRGSTCSPDEQPEAEIELSSFYIDTTPVTNGLFGAFIDDGGYRKPSLWTPTGWSFVAEHGLQAPNYWHDPIWGVDDMPVTGVSWWEALAFARWIGKTLPTEAQWEYAWRGPAANTYPWGRDLPDLSLANYAPNAEPVDRRPTRPDAAPRNASACGCRDLAGNFADWCLDNYTTTYQVAGKDPLYFTDERDDHVVRGGSGLHDEDYLRCSARDSYHPGLRDNLIGFRCVRLGAR